MKYKNRVKKLEGRIKDYERMTSSTKQNPEGFKKPGSFKK